VYVLCGGGGGMKGSEWEGANRKRGSLLVFVPPYEGSCAVGELAVNWWAPFRAVRSRGR
jgi:hypothetical protein